MWWSGLLWSGLLSFFWSLYVIHIVIHIINTQYIVLYSAIITHNTQDIVLCRGVLIVQISSLCVIHIKSTSTMPNSKCKITSYQSSNILPCSTIISQHLTSVLFLSHSLTKIFKGLSNLIFNQQKKRGQATKCSTSQFSICHTTQYSIFLLSHSSDTSVSWSMNS